MRDELTPAFGDLSDIRVHTDASAARASEALDALAFTIGRDLFFNSGSYRPNSLVGRQMIAHEAAHAVQQRHATDKGVSSLASSGRVEIDAHRAAANRVRPEVEVDSAQVMTLPKGTTVKSLYEDFLAEGRWYERDDKRFGAGLFELASESEDNYPGVLAVLELLDRGPRWGVAEGFLEAAGTVALDEFARTDRGRTLVEGLRNCFLRPGLFMREEVGLKISVDDVLGRAEGRNRAEGVLEKAAKSADASAEIVPAQFVDRAEIPDRLRLIRLMALRIQTQYPNDLDIVPALATVQADLETRFGGLLFDFFYEDGRQVAITQLIVERCYQALTQLDLILPTLTDPTGADPAQIHRLAIAGRVRSAWVDVLGHAVSPEGPRRLAVAEAESAALPGALSEFYLKTVAAHKPYFVDMSDGSDDMVDWSNWVSDRMEALYGEVEALTAARVAGQSGLDERADKAAAEAEILQLSIAGIQLWEAGVRAHETLYIEIHPLLNIVPHVPLAYRDAARIRARCQQMKTAALAGKLETLRILADRNRSDPAIQQYLQAMPLFVAGAKVFPSLVGSLLVTLTILRVSLFASSSVGALIPAAEGASGRALLARAGLEALTFTAVSRTLQGVASAPSKLPFLVDLALNAGLFTVLRFTLPAVYNAFAARGMDVAAWAVSHATAFAMLQGFGAIHFRLERKRWPTAAEFGDMAVEGLVLYAFLARTYGGAPQRGTRPGRLAVLETLYEKYGDHLEAVEVARNKLANRIAEELRAGRGDDPGVRQTVESEAKALDDELQRLIDEIGRDPEVGERRLRAALSAAPVRTEEMGAELLTRSFDLAPDVALRQTGGEAQFTYAPEATKPLVEGLEARGAVITELVDASGRHTVVAETAGQPPMFFSERGPVAAFEPGTAPRKAGEMTRFLRSSGLSESEILGYGGADASRLGSRTAGRVARLAEHFTAADLKVLGDFLWRYDIIIDDVVADTLMERVSAGDMADAVANLEHKAVLIEESGVPSDLADTLNVSVVGRPRPSTTAATGPKFDPAWRMAEKQLAPALESTFGPGWQPSRRTPAPGAAPGERLGSTVPEYYNPDLEMAFEVKRLNIEELGVGPAGEVVGTPSKQSKEALGRARMQVAGRRWAHPKGTKQCLVFNVTGQGATDISAVGRQLVRLIGEHFIKYDRVFLQDGGTLTEIK